MTDVPKRRPPSGPRGHWAFGNARAFKQDPLAFLQTCAREHGDVAMLAPDTYLVSSPSTIGTVLSDDDTRYGKSDPDPRVRRAAFPASVMNSSGSDWRCKRNAMQPAFRAALIRDYVAQAAAVTQAVLHERIDLEIAQDIRVLMTGLCARLGAGFLLGDQAQAPHLLRMLPMVDVILEQTRDAPKAPCWWPGHRRRRMRQARNALESALENILTQRVNHAPGTGALLESLLAEDPTGRSAWCRDEIAAMLMSALEPMAAGLTWTLLLLAQHPTTAHAVADEADAALADSEADTHLIERLPLARACVKEAMRLYPPAWLTARIAQCDTTLHGFAVPRGTRLLVSQWVVQRDPRHFSDPETFAPARWLDAATTASPLRYTYFPFGGGPRSCIGSRLSLSQMTVVVASVLRTRTLHLSADAQPTPLPALVLRPLDVRMALRRRP